jgi:hypothetical protein
MNMGFLCQTDLEFNSDLTVCRFFRYWGGAAIVKNRYLSLCLELNFCLDLNLKLN